MRASSSKSRPYLLWDSDCRFCRNSVALLARIDRAGFVFLPYQEFPQTLWKEFGLTQRRCEREVQLITRSGRVLGGAFAINYFLLQQPKWRVLVLLSCLFPVVFLVEVLLYRVVAKNRGFFSKILFPKQ